MMISIRPLAALCLLLLACGPKISGESAEEGEASSTTEAPGTESGPPGSSGGPTTTPLDTGEGTADSGVVDTGEVWLDLPTSCSTFAQDCPPGFKCMPWASDGGNSWNATRCVPIAPDPNAPGEPCTVEGSGVSGLDDCDGTSMCWDVDPDTLEGRRVYDTSRPGLSNAGHDYGATLTEAELDWLRASGRFAPTLADRLEDFRFTGDVDAMAEGTPGTIS